MPIGASLYARGNRRESIGRSRTELLSCSRQPGKGGHINMPSDRDHMFDDDAELDAQESRIQELKRQAEETSGGEMFAVEFDRKDVPPAAREQFWATVQQYNT